MLGGAIAAFVYWCIIDAHHCDSETQNNSGCEQDLIPPISKKTDSGPENVDGPQCHYIELNDTPL